MGMACPEGMAYPEGMAANTRIYRTLDKNTCHRQASPTPRRKSSWKVCKTASKQSVNVCVLHTEVIKAIRGQRLSSKCLIFYANLVGYTINDELFTMPGFFHGANRSNRMTFIEPNTNLSCGHSTQSNFEAFVGTCQCPIGPKISRTLGKNTCHRQAIA